MMLSNCVVSGCLAQGGNGGGGGGGADCMTGRGCGGHGGNGGPAFGGGVYNSGYLFVIDCTFHTNRVTPGSAGLGGFNPSIVCPTGSPGSAPDGAGGAGEGGDIYSAENGTLVMLNCTLSGGGFSNHGLSTAVNCTIVGEVSAPAGELQFLNSILSGNGAPSGRITSLGHNLVRVADSSIVAWQSSDLLGLNGQVFDPGLGPLRDNGGSTPTHALLPTSAAIDAGDDSVLGPPHNLSTDQRGLARQVGDQVDIGAVEFSFLSRLVTTLNDSGGGSLRSAIGAADPFDRVIFHPVAWGKIRLTGGELLIDKPLSIVGPGASQLAISGNNNSRVFRIQGAVDIHGLTITEGLARGADGGGPQLSGSPAHGCGIYNEGALRLFDCMITTNRCQGGKGGDGQLGGPLVTPGVGGYARGAAIYTVGSLALTRCTLLGNIAQGGPGGDGGFNEAGTMAGDGGTGGGADGGAIWNGAAAIYLENCTLADNHARGGGGGYPAYPSPGVEGVAGRGGNANGGAVFRAAILQSCTITGNSADGGWSLAGNRMGLATSGGIIAGPPTGSSTARNSIIAGNTVSGVLTLAPNTDSTWLSLGWNLIGITDGSSGWTTNDFLGNSTFPLNALLGPCQDNGGPVWTMCPLGGSPARDNGNSDLPTDARGGRRIVDFLGIPNAPGGNGSDIGALEVDSLLRIASFNKTGNAASARFKSDAGNNYVLQQTSVITNRTWTNVVGTGRMGNGRHFDVADPGANAPHRFYRVRSDPAPSLPPPVFNGPGNALSFDGVDDYVTAPAGVWFSGDFTVEGWVYVRSYNEWSRLLDFGNVDAAGEGVDNILVALTEGATGRPHFHVVSGSTAGPGLVTPNPIPLNQWTHLACVLNGTTGMIYVNGNAVASGPMNQPRAVLRTGCYLGRSNWPRDQYANAVFDEVRIWNVARTAGQIQEAMRRQLDGNESGLVACWHLNEGSGILAFDATGGNTGILRNGPAWVASTILPFAPNAATLAATAVAGTSATVNGSANPNGAATMGYFEWGPTVSFGNVTPAQSLGSGTATVTWNRPLAGLTPGALYYYRAVATNLHGVSFGEVLSFR